MQVRFVKRADGGSDAAIERDDGVRLQLRSYDRTGAVPHDAVHLLGERALGMRDGLWGSIAAGALFDSMTVLEGRRHDRRKRSDEVRRAHAEGLRLAETVVGVLQQSLDGDGATVGAALDRAWGITHTGRSPFSADQVALAVSELRILRTSWRSLAVGEGVTYSWTVRTAGRVRRTRRR